MRLLLSSVLLLGLSSASLMADGLIYKLPKDGTSVNYELKMTMSSGDDSREGTGFMILKSVGREKRDGVPCRWIELRMEAEVANQKREVVTKLLIPEKHLAKGKSPIDHVKKCWLRQGGDPMEVEAKGNRTGPLPIFLAGPAKGAKKLAAKVVNTKLGKLKSIGLASEVKFERDGKELKAKVMSRLSDKVPFGVLHQVVNLTTDRGDGQTQTVKIVLTADAVGTGAKSDLPDKK